MYYCVGGQIFDNKSQTSGLEQNSWQRPLNDYIPDIQKQKAS